MPTVSLTLIAKPGCHLCDDARDIVRAVLGELEAELPELEVTMTELSILDNPALSDEFAEEIPVVMIDGRVHTIWRVEPARLRTALREAAA
ncbi:glutaredoxin family protein [Herbiconiux sp. KACC 21604]|uniref:glutaredoxin family protein n=1 Tax=unclassified Herbiconiux TaxID=2618217 RepID=UPI001492F87A|nr:glutaredoxin family protein [Herbiconiux sp. SALV-R1]QJU52215.1 glutaredoxin family protein [Herbiconiux sp. SALV-R1]WPO87058.1 glutaredoxin family protein [Herbiconiux sp. KACC 21604]